MERCVIVLEDGLKSESEIFPVISCELLKNVVHLSPANITGYAMPINHLHSVIIVSGFEVIHIDSLLSLITRYPAVDYIIESTAYFDQCSKDWQKLLPYLHMVKGKNSYKYLYPYTRL